MVICVKILDVKLTISAVRQSQFPTDNKEEFLLVGRSNVGKSSFINTLINRKNFARTSSKPGKTQTLNFYLINEYFYIAYNTLYGNVLEEINLASYLMAFDLYHFVV